MKIPYYQIDAFTGRVFSGNPAGVCVIDSWPEDDVLLSIAAENNLSETAFILGSEGDYRIRWFTPAIEVDLCGHATLASAFVVFNHLDRTLDTVRFDSQSGPLIVAREDDLLNMDFPRRAPTPCAAPAGLVTALGAEPIDILCARDYLIVLESESTVRCLEPDMTFLAGLDRLGICITARGDEVDFVSRFFAPAVGIPEDPVTGSAHSTLIPYWSERLAKSNLHAHQLSARGGELFCEDTGDRVRIAGRAVQYLEGTIEV